MTKRIAIVGGGAAGLAAAYEVARAAPREGPPVEVRLFESAESLGGVIRTERADGFLLDTGPDSLFRGKPAAIDLAREIGLGDELLDARRQELTTLIWIRGKLRPLPPGLEMLVPSSIPAFFKSSLMSPLGKARVCLEPFVPAKKDDRDESLAAFVRRRLGSEAVRRIADPLLAGIHAGDPERLSVRSIFPRLAEMERLHGSLANGMRKGRAARGASRGASPSATLPFVSFRGGMRRLVDGLTRAIPPAALRTKAEIKEIGRAGEMFRLVWRDGSTWDAHACILAVPSEKAAALLDRLSPDAAAALRRVRYVSTAAIFMGFRAAGALGLPPSTGFLIPSTERRRIFGCTIVSNKFEGRAPDGCVLLRAFAGGALDEEALDRSDDQLVADARRDLASVLGPLSDPILVRVARWNRANPQYEVGHERIVQEVDRALAALPGLRIAGSGLRGVGIPDAVSSGREEAAKALALLAGTPARLDSRPTGPYRSAPVSPREAEPGR